MGLVSIRNVDNQVIGINSRLLVWILLTLLIQNLLLFNFMLLGNCMDVTFGVHGADAISFMVSALAHVSFCRQV